MVSTTEVGGNNKRNSKGNWKNKPRSETQFSKFTGAAISDSILYNKVITSGTNQDRQIISLVEIFPGYIGITGYADWAKSFPGMERKDIGDLVSTTVHRGDYGIVDAASMFHWRTDALDTKYEYDRDYKIWGRNVTAGIKQWKHYVNNGECIFLAIQGQVEPSLWDKIKDDVRFPVVQASKWPIELIKLMKDRTAGTMTWVWKPLALITQIQKYISHLQNPHQGGLTPTIGDYKQEVELFVDTTCQLGGLFHFVRL